MKATITKALLQGLPAPADGAAKLRVFDDRLPGFIAERRRAGITFYLRYTDERRRVREAKLGRLGDVTLDQARKAAERIRSQVSLGEDPLAERDRRRAVPSVAAFFEDRYLPYAKERLASIREVERYFRGRILPAFGSKALDEVTPADVAALRQRMIAEKLSPSTVNRHLAYVRACFNMAAKWQVVEGRNPAASPGMLRERQRDHYLSAVETRALLAALDASPSLSAAAALALLVVSGARKQEVMRARWEHVDLGRCAIVVPKAKSGKARTIPLSPFAAEIVRRQLARRPGDSPWVFPSSVDPSKPVSDAKKVWAAAKKAAGLPDHIVIHSLRHSFASALANSGVALFEIGRVLGHSQLSTTTRYAHHAPERLVATAATATLAWDLAGKRVEEPVAAT
jgi:integrase